MATETVQENVGNDFFTRVEAKDSTILSSHGRGLGPRDALKKDSRGPTHVPASCALDSKPAARAAQPPPPRAGGPGTSQPSFRSLLRRASARPCPLRPPHCLSVLSPPGRAPPGLGLASGLPAAPGCPARRKPPVQELPPPRRPQPTARPDARGGGQWPDRIAAYGVPCGEVNPKGRRPLVTWCPTLARGGAPSQLGGAAEAPLEVA